MFVYIIQAAVCEKELLNLQQQAYSPIYNFVNTGWGKSPVNR
jgi:hypothetical protein